MNLISKLGGDYTKKDSCSPVGFIMNMLQNSSNTITESKKLAILQPDEDKKIIPHAIKNDKFISKTKINNNFVKNNSEKKTL